VLEPVRGDHGGQVEEGARRRRDRDPAFDGDFVGGQRGTVDLDPGACTPISGHADLDRYARRVADGPQGGG
jgi:hypothetical protein